MITIRDTLTLSLTKLRTRKIRLIITVVVSGLLFTALIAGSLIFRGAFASIKSFGEEGLGKRFVVTGYDTSASSENLFAKPEILNRAREIQKDLIARKKAEAKKLNIEYSEQSEPPVINEYDTPNGKEQSVNGETSAGKQAIAEYLQKNPPRSSEDFKKLAEPYGAFATYSSRYAPYTREGSMQVLKDGKESYDLANNNTKQQYGPPRGVDSFLGSWSLMSADLLQPFAIKGQSLKSGNDGSIPVIIPVSAAEELLNLKALPGTASSADKLARTKELRQKATDVRFNVCHRNAASSALISNAISTQQEIERNKKNKDYVKPDLIYGLPKEPCTAAPVIRDVRSADQKKRDAKQEQFDQMFGQQAPSQSAISFRIVGLTPDYEFQSAIGIGQIIGSTVGSSIGTGWFTPLEESVKNPIIASYFDTNNTIGSGQIPTQYAEFHTSAQAKKFIDEKSCQPNYMNPEVQKDPFKECREKEQLYSLNAFGSNSLALDAAKKQFSKFFTIAALVVAAIGSIIMMGTVGRMIADSRRETAVFRAIGAKRMDIAQIYILYTFIVSLLISGFAVLGGVIAALVAQDRYADGLTVQALVAYNAQDLSRTFSLFQLYVPDILLLVGLSLGVSLISISIPLLRNVRRNPIRDMRDDT